MKIERSKSQKLIDFITFPFRAFTLFEENRFGLSSLRTERFDYVKKEVLGYCLDLGCGRNNLFIKQYMGSNGIGIDVFEYEGLNETHMVKDMTKLPFPDNTFSSATLIACINHIPEPIRDAELKDIYRCTKTGGNIIVTMGNPLAELVVHKVVFIYDKVLGTHVDMDTERGMDEDEAYYLTDKEITERLKKAGYSDIKKKFFFTQWGFNHLFVGYKK